MCLLPAPVPPLAPDSSDDDGDRTWTADDQRDFEDQQSPPPSPHLGIRLSAFLLMCQTGVFWIKLLFKMP